MKRTYIGIGLVSALSLGAFSATAQIVVNDSSYTLSTVATNLRNPQAIARDGAGQLYIADAGNGQVLKGPEGGPYAPVLTGIPVINFNGNLLGPLGLYIAPDQTLLVGRAGTTLQQPTILHTQLNGSPISTLAAVPGGGNWSSLWVDGAGRLLATSSNGDALFQAPRSGASFGALANLVSTGPGLIAPTGIVIYKDVMYVSYFGSFLGSGSVATHNPQTGTIVSSSFSTGITGGGSGLALLSSTELLVSEYGDGANAGKLQIINIASGAKTELATGINRCTSVHVDGVGNIYFSEQNTINGTDGRVLKLAPKCPGDLDGDGAVGQSDLGLLLGAFGICPGEPGYDTLAGNLASADPCVTQADLGVLLAGFGCVP